jgi:hypothetical protein
VKFTLKNRPQYPDKTSGLTKRDYVRACIAYDDWLEGFEKELREILKDAEECMQGNPEIYVTEYCAGKAVLAKQILGEKP